jgi:hypothetical protein
LSSVVTRVMQDPGKESLRRVAAQQCVSIEFASSSNHSRKFRGFAKY